VGGEKKRGMGMNMIKVQYMYVCMYENSIMKTTKTVKEEVAGVRS
jgi:hypothetical protein